MLTRSIATVSVAEQFLKLLSDRGVRYLFANAGTDFAPLIEAFSELKAQGERFPVPVTVPHENVAIHMALGYWLVTGEMQAVMVHVSVGTANAVCGLLNIARANAPVLFMAGRTPITESGVLGTRNLHIHWTQEMFDQAGMVRELVKWEYELRHPTQLQTVVDRAIGIANSEPKGPVYLTLPREVLTSPFPGTAVPGPSRHGTSTPPYPDPLAIERTAKLISASANPLIITSSAGVDPVAVQALGDLAGRFAIPVVQYAPRCMAIASDHPMHAGYDPAPFLADADLVLVVDCAVPWIPERMRPAADARVVHIGPDPLYARIPIRGFECDLAVTGTAAASLQALDRALGIPSDEPAARINARRKRILARRSERQTALAEAVERHRHQTPIHPVWFTHCVDQAKGDDCIIIREAPQLAMDHMTLASANPVYAAGAAGGLGWGMGAAVGAAMAAPHRLVMAIEGDGSYMFCEPVSAHYTALEQKAPFLTVIFNNLRWNEVRAATRHLYPEGRTTRQGAYEPLTHFDPGLRLEKVVESVGGHGERVTDPTALPDALQRAIRIVRVERRQAVLNVICSS